MRKTFSKTFRFTLMIMLLVVVSSVSMIAQSDSVHLTLPVKFDFTTIATSYQTGQLIANALIVLVAGYLSPYIPFIRNMTKVTKRVLVTVIPLLIVVGVFGFGNDVKTLLFQVFGGLITGSLVYDKVLEPIGLKTGNPINQASDLKL